MKRLAVFISGRGSNLQAILDQCPNDPIPAQVVVVVSDQSRAAGIRIAAQQKIPIIILDDHPSRSSFESILCTHLDHWQPDLILLAGFMRILSPYVIRCYPRRILNIHPSLLPRYKGLNTHQRVLEAGESEHGATVHFVSEAVDGGKIILQTRVPVYADDDATTLRQRVLDEEHILYPKAIQIVLGRTQLNNPP